MNADEPCPTSSPAPPPTGASRRQVVGWGAAGVAAAATASAMAGFAAGKAHVSDAGGTGSAPSVDPTAQVFDFRGEHQAGITTPAQDRLHFVALDVTTTDATQLRTLLTAWTTAAERMCLGAEAAPGGLVGGGPSAVPQDTGEAYDLPPSGLTITIGYGRSLFDGRFGLAGRKPAALADLPAFPGDDLDPSKSGGDIAIQACANDPQVAVHAVRNLIRLGFGVTSVRWSQLGFGRTSSTTRTQPTPRNLFGFKDGTSNIKAEDSEQLREHVWVPAGEEAGSGNWMAGGSYLVARRIRMHIEVWDRTHLAEQEQVFGRTKKEGAPLSSPHTSGREFDQPDFAATDAHGQPMIPANAHVRLAHSHNLNGVKILRRGYNFTDGTDGVGHLDAGLFFVAFMRNPAGQFVPMQQALARSDGLNEYIEHTSSAVFACPPGLGGNQDWGTQLFG